MPDEYVKDMLTSSEVVKLLGIAHITLKRWRKAGRIPYVEYPKNRYRYSKKDIEQLLSKGFSKKEIE